MRKSEYTLYIILYYISHVDKLSSTYIHTYIYVYAVLRHDATPSVCHEDSQCST